MLSALALVAGALLDRLLGEPSRWHPLVGFGALAGRLEARFNLAASRLRGILAVVCLLGLGLASVWGLEWLLSQFLPDSFAAFTVATLAVYWALGWQSLREHVARVAEALATQDLPRARTAVGQIVSRETSVMSERQVCRAGVESLLENTADAVVAPLVWFALLGAPGAVVYRLINTLDALWGYRTSRYRQFGWAAARLDDIVNWLPARLTALLFAYWGRGRVAIACWQCQAPRCASPNGGVVMCAGAGALGISLGGLARYHGATIRKPAMGIGPAPVAADIYRALRLVEQTLWSALVISVLLNVLLWRVVGAV